MYLVGSAWTPEINILLIWCPCGYFFWHRADHWRVFCPKCKSTDNLQSIRDSYCEKLTLPERQKLRG